MIVMYEVTPHETSSSILETPNKERAVKAARDWCASNNKDCNVYEILYANEKNKSKGLHYTKTPIWNSLFHK